MCPLKSICRVVLVAVLSLALCRDSVGALKTGDAMPNLKAYPLEGKLPDKLKGQVILLDFWASWCAPCKSSFPAIQDLHKRYASQGLVVVAISVDENRQDMERFLQKMNVTFAVARDAQHKLVAAADVSAMPTSFIVDRNGRIRFVHNGYRGDETAKKYAAEIESLLKEVTK